MSEITVSPKLQRTLDRFQAKISSGEFYEAHQTLRTIANRNVRSKSYSDAIALLNAAATILLNSTQPATGSDLVSYLIEVYNESETRCDAQSVTRLTDLIQLFDANEPTLKQVATEAVNWSIKFGNSKFGDEKLHFALGQKFSLGESGYEAERHLLLSKDGYEAYSTMLWDWYLLDKRENIGLYTARIVLNYLVIRDIKHAKLALSTFIAKFNALEEHKFSTVKQFNSEFLIYESIPILNLLQLLVITVQTQNTSYFQKLGQRYSGLVAELQLNTAFELLGKEYFGIVQQKQANLMDMMGGLFK